MIKRALRKLIFAKKNETIYDAIDRHKSHLEKFFYRKKYSAEDLKSVLIDCGLQSGDTVLIHCSYRRFYNFTGNPDDIINIIQDIIGRKGTVVMPCYGEDKYYFDVDNSVSKAGVLSEVFRNREGVIRSKCSHFSVAAWGKYSQELIKDHEKSIYGFDENSPLYKLYFVKNSKVVFLGMGANPTKNSILHTAFNFLNEDKKIEKLISDPYESVLVSEGIKQKKTMIKRVSGHPNRKKIFRKILNLSSPIKKKISNLDIVVVGARECVDNAVELGKKGVYCYKNMSKIVR
ncbi:MAG: AAC(3) family N-acetyltransferase [Erysipelotrichaceae bacterium]|nr:AAC(3) family N-acetyltransferase [Erysipelotrichaceae bacterium]